MSANEWKEEDVENNGHYSWSNCWAGLWSRILRFHESSYGMIVGNMGVETLVERDATELKLAWLLIGSFVLLGAGISFYFRKCNLRDHWRPIEIGTLLGAIFAVAITLLVARMRNEFPFVGKAPQSAIFWERTVAVPLGMIIGGLVGFFLRRGKSVA